MHTKIQGRVKLARTVALLRRRGKRIVFTNGCFDILHSGHVTYLDRAKHLGDILVVGLNTDTSVRALKGPTRPLNRQRDRATVLAALESVDYVTLFGERTPERLIKLLKPDILTKGGDWKVADIVGAADVAARGGRVVSIPFVRGYSTTSFVRRIETRAGRRHAT